MQAPSYRAQVVLKEQKTNKIKAHEAGAGIDLAHCSEGLAPG
jgi:hypothetical protein